MPSSSERRRYRHLLGIPPGASQSEIRQAYRRLAKRWHPDRNPGDPTARERFKEINEAYQALADTFGGGKDPSRSFPRHSPSLGRRASGRPDNSDLRLSVPVSFERAVRGGRTLVYAPWRKECPACRGGEPEDEGECSRCRGQGVIQAKRLRRIRIPPGTRDGDVIRLPGGAGPSGAEASDLVLEIAVRPHTFFRRDGRDLRATLSLAVSECVLGSTVVIPTMAGSRARIRIPPGCPTGTTFRVGGHGVGTGAEDCGDLLLEVRADWATRSERRQGEQDGHVTVEDVGRRVSEYLQVLTILLDRPLTERALDTAADLMTCLGRLRRPALLANLDPAAGRLDERYAGSTEAGIADVVEGTATFAEIAVPVPNAPFAFLPAGRELRPTVEESLEHPGEGRHEEVVRRTLRSRTFSLLVGRIREEGGSLGIVLPPSVRTTTSGSELVDGRVSIRSGSPASSVGEEFGPRSQHRSRRTSRSSPTTGA